MTFILVPKRGGESPSRPPPNNGMRPTADRTDFKFNRRLGRAGDVGCEGRASVTSPDNPTEESEGATVN
jgi:hypothetical protein